ncbi:unnamed protein product [Mytilus coruscus]|uniref:Uncharacterized protein n=1 Tax=Mytilus coruscus TaxID=42192 RepID=A0A6J8AYC3_MYTCO|nr:unnamed protein product [Mytilus coruscus]CAC5376280.1 unnamed protein product [Mytilus coruscus]
MILYDLYYIRTKVWIIFLFILFRCTDFIQGTSIQILNATCPRSPSCNNVTIAICTGGCDNANSTCFSSKFEPKIGYKHVFKCSEKFINVIVAKVYFGKENYTLCEDEKGRKSKSDTCLKHPNATCRLDNHFQAHNVYNNYSFEVKIGDECTEFLIRCTDFIQGTSIQILNATCPGSCNNVTIAICTGGCDNATSTCFSPKFEPNIGYKHVFKCSEKFINLIVAKVYFGKENYTLCEVEKGRNDTCLKQPTATCKLDNHLPQNSINNYSLEVKIGDECTEFRRQNNRVNNDDLHQRDREEGDMPAILRERTLIHPLGPIQHNI